MKSNTKNSHASNHKLSKRLFKLSQLLSNFVENTPLTSNIPESNQSTESFLINKVASQT